MVELISLKILRGDIILADLKDSFRALSSTIYGGGLKDIRYVIFKKVGKDFSEPDPRSYASRIAEEIGCPPTSTAVFLTSADIVKDHIILEYEDFPREEILLTLGLGPLSCIDGSSSKAIIGTLNTLLVIDECLTTEAAIDLAMLIGAVKSAAFSDLGISCGGFRRAYSTVTDAVIVAYRSEGCRNFSRYGGPATNVGRAASRLVYEAITELAQRKLGFEDLLKYYTSFTCNDLAALGLKIYRRAPVPGVSDNEVLTLIVRELKKHLKDPNLWALIRGAHALTFYGLAGTIPGLSREEYFEDSKKIIADELMGIALSIYINGWKGMFNYYWIDRVKEGIEEFRKLPMFIDDVIAALMGGVLSKVYDELLGRLHS